MDSAAVAVKIGKHFELIDSEAAIICQEMVAAAILLHGSMLTLG